ncbi:MAG: YbhB/YbcL family Raf kinase inhibitor-like protein [Chitinophagaceae bacterium]|nr:YbhB/YbcL family Raf kinase inhibitor-like protein [Chitinophagaceae bacterium]
MKQRSEATSVTSFKKLKIRSSAFHDHEMIPALYTCDGKNVNPPLAIHQIPAEARSLAIIVDDPDAPNGTFVHWVMWNIPVTHTIRENQAKGLQGLNDFHHHRYNGPCPPGGIHRYFFKVYALNSVLDLPVDTTKEHLEKVMSHNIIGFGELVGLYTRQ